MAKTALLVLKAFKLLLLLNELKIEAMSKVNLTVTKPKKKNK